LCRFPARLLHPTNTERRFWLDRFSDDEIAEMAAAVFGAPADLARIASERRRLAVALALPPGLEP